MDGRIPEPLWTAVGVVSGTGDARLLEFEMDAGLMLEFEDPCRGTSGRYIRSLTKVKLIAQSRL